MDLKMRASAARFSVAVNISTSRFVGSDDEREGDEGCAHGCRIPEASPPVSRSRTSRLGSMRRPNRGCDSVLPAVTQVASKPEDHFRPPGSPVRAFCAFHRSAFQTNRMEPRSISYFSRVGARRLWGGISSTSTTGSAFSGTRRGMSATALKLSGMRPCTPCHISRRKRSPEQVKTRKPLRCWCATKTTRPSTPRP
jgi:hypothetical protein